MDDQQSPSKRKNEKQKGTWRKSETVVNTRKRKRSGDPNAETEMKKRKFDKRKLGDDDSVVNRETKLQKHDEGKEVRKRENDRSVVDKKKRNDKDSVDNNRESKKPNFNEVPNSHREGSMERQFSFDSNVSTTEINDHISQCLKLNVEDKINDKNVFQLKMIDFLAHSLRIQNPNISNLNVASACLDISGKIYGLRVDKVYSDLWKIFGVFLNGERDDLNEDDDPLNNEGVIRLKKKKKRANYNIITKSEALKGNVEIYNPFELIHVQKDTLTSDMLLQARTPQHVNHGVAFNVYDDVVVDKLLPVTARPSKFKISAIINDENSINKSFCEFKFLDGLAEEYITVQKDVETSTFSQYRFNLSDDESAEFDDFFEDTRLTIHNEMNTTAVPANNLPSNDDVDFQDSIVNNANLDVNYEYSYLQSRHKLRWAGPSHWKIMNKDQISIKPTKIVKNLNSKKSKKKDYVMSFEKNSIEDIKSKFDQKIVKSNFQSNWSGRKLLICKKDKPYDVGRFDIFYLKPQWDIFSNYKEEKNEVIYLNDSGVDFNDLDDLDDVIDTVEVDDVIKSIQNNLENSPDKSTFSKQSPFQSQESVPNESRVPLTSQMNYIPDEALLTSADNCIPSNQVSVQSTSNTIRPHRNSLVKKVRQEIICSNLLPLPNLKSHQNILKQNETTVQEDQGGFTHNNLVSMPRIIETAHIQYALRPKVIDMRRLQKIMWRNVKTLQNDDEFVEQKNLSYIYSKIKHELKFPLSPALAFISMLHLANIKKFFIKNSEDISDITM